MPSFTVRPAARPLRGIIPIPADKSISHRALILGALADGTVHIQNLLSSETVAATNS